MIKESFCPEETYALGKSLGEAAKPGDVICLNGNLGVGKTVFTQGFADGLAITEPVNSPTFTIVREYRSGRLPLYHFDVYRLSDGMEFLDTGAEDYLEDSGLSVIEWADIVADVLPPDALVVMIEYAEEGKRKVTIL
jgi:tRNA threonylcarbamoyladenosine biosynthesis protein TsaE